MNEFPRVWVEALFKRFAVMYGSKWTAMWADVPMGDVLDGWQDDLGGVNGEQVKRALEHCKSHCPFPPTLPEFVGFCRQFRVEASNVLYLPAPRGELPDNAVLRTVKAARVGVPKLDGKAWARRILAEPKSYPALSRQFAEEALGVVGNAS